MSCLDVIKSYLDVYWTNSARVGLRLQGFRLEHGIEIAIERSQFSLSFSRESRRDFSSGSAKYITLCFGSRRILRWNNLIRGSHTDIGRHRNTMSAEFSNTHASNPKTFKPFLVLYIYTLNLFDMISTKMSNPLPKYYRHSTALLKCHTQNSLCLDIVHYWQSLTGICWDWIVMPGNWKPALL